MIRLLPFLFLCLPCSAAIVSADRTPGAQGVWYAGVDGGIPTGRATNVTLAAGSTVAQINSAISLCPSNQVVQLAAGHFTIDSTVVFDGYSGVTLRGAGNATILDFTNGGTIYFQGPHRVGNGTPEQPNQIVNWTAGYSQGTSNISISASGPNLAVGVVVCLDQLNDTNLIGLIGEGGQYITNNSAVRTNFDRAQQQYTRVTAIDGTGTNLTIWPPVYMTNIQSSLKPMCWWLGPAITMSGVENFVINNTNGNNAPLVFFWQADDCWAKGITALDQGSVSFQTYNSFRCEFRDLLIRSAHSYGTACYGVQLQLCSACLVENCAFEFVSSPVVWEMGSSGNVVGYCFATNGIYISYNNVWVPPSYNPHFTHGHMNLVEGCWGTQFSCDMTHGSGSHWMLFRDRFIGQERATQSANTFCVADWATNRVSSVVGCVLGTAGWHTSYETSPSTLWDGNNNTHLSIYRLGNIDDANTLIPNDPAIATTIWRHGSYDVVNNAQVWDASDADHNIPNSLYLTAKPAYWGNLPWPPFDPANPSLASPANLPAYAIYTGSNPNAGSIFVGNLTVINLRN